MADTAEEITQLGVDLKELRALYDQYFAGLERMPPTGKYDHFVKRFRQLTATRINNTAQKFRLNSLQHQFLTYERHWQKICRQIEEGTYERDRKRAARLVAKHKAEEKAAPAPTNGAEAAAPAAAPAAAAARQVGPAPAASGLSDAKIKAIYDAYMTARQRVGEKAPVNYDALAATLRKQVPAIMEQHKAKGVEFKIIIKDGKAILKALPKM